MYKGQILSIPLGGGGLVSDLPQSRIAPSNLIDTNNVTFVNGYAEKHPGSRVWNQTNPSTGATTTISGGIQTFAEYFPSELNAKAIISELCYKTSVEFYLVNKFDMDY